MSLQNIFEMAKADRYAADGREEFAKAREADVEDRTYNIGEISAKTGLQKTANGWVKPKSGKQPGAKKEEGNSITGANGNLSERAKFAYESNAKKLSTEGLESVIRNKDKVFAKHNDEIAEIYKKELAKRNGGSSESQKLIESLNEWGDDKMPPAQSYGDLVRFAERHDKDFSRSKVGSYTAGQWRDYLKSLTPDSAPRALTGDCKIRVKK